MAENFYTILTNIGLAKFANAPVTGSVVNIANMAAGDGNGAYYNPTSTQIALKNQKWTGPVSAVELDPNNPNWIVIETVIPASAGGFIIREVGVYDLAGDLIAVGKYPETYKPVLSEGSTKDLYIRMIIEVSNASAVTLKIDPTVVIASRKYVDDKFTQSIGPINQTVTDLKNTVTQGTIVIPSLQTDDKKLAGAINEIDSELTTHLAEIVTVATPNKILKLNANAKLPASITGDAATVGGKTIEDLDDGTWTKITEVTLNTAFQQVDFASLQQYKAFKLFFRVINANKSISNPITVCFNDDLTTSDYYTRYVESNDVIVSQGFAATTFSGIPVSTIKSTPGYSPSFGEVTISNSNAHKTVLFSSFCKEGTLKANLMYTSGGGVWASNNIINKISVVGKNGTIDVNSNFVLWGCK